MSMTGRGLADRIRDDMGFPAPTSKQLIGWGTGVITHVQKAAVVNHLSGTIVGFTKAASSLSGGKGLPVGVISSFTSISVVSEKLLVSNSSGYLGDMPVVPLITISKYLTSECSSTVPYNVGIILMA